MKRIINLLALQFVIIAITAQTSVDIGLLRYTFNGAYATVSKYLGGEEPCVIPPSIEYNGLTYTVTTIGLEAFYSKSVTEIHLPETITAIQSKAFRACSKLEKINLPNSLVTIGYNALLGCIGLTEIIIPEKVTTMSSQNSGYNAFSECTKLRTLIYTGKQPPSYWTATSFTYVPDKQAYSAPYFSINSAQVIEMITFHETELSYTGQSFTPTWTNNVEGWSATPNFPTLDMSVGWHEVLIPFTFVRGNESFTANVMYRYKVTANQLTVTVNNVSREYGEENPQFMLFKLDDKDKESSEMGDPILPEVP